MKTTRMASAADPPEDLPKIRELLTAEEYEKLLKRLEVRSVAPAHERTPNAAGTLGAS